MTPEKLPMQRFRHDGLDLCYLECGPESGTPVLLIHGFASTAHVNWVFPGWFKTLGNAGYRVLAFDNRGHGDSDKPHDPAAYHPPIMAGDALALLDHLGIERAHVMGYSMGARIAAFMAMAESGRIRSLVFGGLGLGMVEGVGDWQAIAAALSAEDPQSITDRRAGMFRSFADQTGSDRAALAACIQTSRALVRPDALARIDRPVLIAVGTEDDIAGSAEGLARLLPDARAVDIPGRDHMLSVGDRVFKRAVTDFLAEQEG